MIIFVYALTKDSDKILSMNKKKKFIIIVSIILLTIAFGTSCSTSKPSSSDLLREYAISLANEQGLANGSADTLEQTGSISENSFPQGIISSEIINEGSDNPYLVVIDSNDKDSLLVKIRIFACVDGEVKELGVQSFRYSDYSPDEGMIYKINSYIQNYEDKTYLVFEEYASQGVAANSDVWQTIYSLENNELVKEKELGYQLMAGLATRWPKFYIDGEEVEGYAEANMSADDINALTAATEKNKEYSDKAMAKFTEIRNSYGLETPDNNLDLDFENTGDASIAQIALDCNTNEYSIKSGGIIAGDTTGGEGNKDESADSENAVVAEANSDGTVFAAYGKLLSDNEAAIRAYHWQNGNSEYGAKPLKPVAFCDINGDGVPELFVMMCTETVREKLGDESAELCIYTYKEGEVCELPYDLAIDRISYNHIASYNAADTGQYLIYKGKGNHLNMYAMYSGGPSEHYYIFAFEVDPECNLILKQSLKNYYSTESGTTEDRYYKDGNEIKDGNSSVFTAGFKDFDKAIIGDLSHNDSSITTLTNQFSENDMLSMSYDDAIAYCESQSK